MPDRASKALARLLVGVNKPMFVLDDVGRFAGASEALLTQLGLTDEELVGRPLHAALDGDERLLAMPGDAQVRLRKRDGSFLEAFVHTSQVEVGKGRSFRVCVLGRRGCDSLESLGSDGDMAIISRDRMREEFNRSLQERFAGEPEPHEALVGRIEIICLDDVRTQLGADWLRLRDRTMATARAIIDRRLAEGDVFAEAENDSFVVCFATLSPEEARIKSDLIVQEIRGKLLGEDAGKFKVQSQVESVILTETEVSAGSDLLSMLVAQLDEARATRTQHLQMTSEQLLKTARLWLSPLETPGQSRTGMAVARIGNEHSDMLSRIIGSDSEAKTIFDLDTLLLTLVIKHLFADGGAKTAAIVLPVHYQTLSERHYLNSYLTLCERMDRGTRKRVLFELHDIPRAAPPSRLQDIFACLTPFAARNLMRVASASTRLGDLTRYRLGMVSLPARREYGIDAAATRAFETFSNLVHGQGCSLLVRDVPDRSAAAWYFEQRVDLLCLASAKEASVG